MIAFSLLRPGFRTCRQWILALYQYLRRFIHLAYELALDSQSDGYIAEVHVPLRNLQGHRPSSALTPSHTTMPFYYQPGLRLEAATRS